MKKKITKKEDNNTSISGHKKSISIRQQYSGPIPPAIEVSKYEEILPGSANRIFKMAESNNETFSKVALSDANVRDRDSQTREMDSKIQRTGSIMVIIFIFIICMTCLVISVIYNDKVTYRITLIAIPSIIILLSIIRPIKATLMKYFSIESNKDKTKK